MENEEEAALNDILNIVMDEVPGVQEETPIVPIVEVTPEIVPENIEAPPEGIESVPPVEEVPSIQENELVPQVNPNDDLLAKLVEGQNNTSTQLLQMQEVMQNQPQAVATAPELSEEEIAMRDLSERLGLPQMLEENKILKEQLSQVQTAEQKRADIEAQQQAQAQQQQEIQTHIHAFKNERPNANEDKIMEFIGKQPQALQKSLDNPDGWRMIDNMLQTQTKPVLQPDAMTSTQTSPTTTSAFQNKKAGANVSDTDLAAELLGL